VFIDEKLVRVSQFEANELFELLMKEKPHNCYISMFLSSTLKSKIFIDSPKLIFPKENKGIHIKKDLDLTNSLLLMFSGAQFISEEQEKIYIEVLNSIWNARSLKYPIKDVEEMRNFVMGLVDLRNESRYKNSTVSSLMFNYSPLNKRHCK
jgi:hypothetical protein